MDRFKVVPQNETQVREWFAAHLDELGYNVEVSQSACPDWILSDDDGNKIRAEAEYASANFIGHGHNSDDCDLVVCWVHTQALPLPVLELSTGTLHPIEGPATKPAERLTQRRIVKNKKRDIQKLFPDVADELWGFTEAYVQDLRAYSEYVQQMTKPRIALLTAARRLCSALMERGADVGNLHPYDLWRLLN